MGENVFILHENRIENGLPIHGGPFFCMKIFPRAQYGLVVIIKRTHQSKQCLLSSNPPPDLK
ncbi:hypothetical protein Pcar_3287 [Syntrophotalea carbinolica DSM 2380]|uniref:Uncharacterized protein n=1 Tax=Syntrophotalea carbinolica (strain DSM 2380 / NBRC 103641 / GraBd1) TaxID=338963 RepID=Q0C6N1_SYNC1|nr:hypothetical protein Pcar_3287 [Syntrophotalea carbinolica DSM 2380]